jgi:HSP20 family molecular chaperone IbpA
VSDDADDEFDDFDESFEEAFEEDFEEAETEGGGRGVDLPSLRDVGRSVGEAVLDGVGRASARLQERRPLAADVLESDDAYLVVFDAPGAEREDLQVRYEDDTVAVRVDRFREFQEGFETRVPGRGLALSGSVTLPEGAAVNADAAEATLTDSGTLRVLVPKREPSGGDEERTVEIEDEEVEEEPAEHDEHADEADDDA